MASRYYMEFFLFLFSYFQSRRAALGTFGFFFFSPKIVWKNGFDVYCACACHIREKIQSNP